MNMNRLVMPLSVGRVPPRTPMRILNKPKYGAFMLESLHVSNAGTPGGAQDWIVNDIEIDGVSQLSVKDLPGALFSSRGIVAGGRHAGSATRFFGLDVIEQDSEVVTTVTYIGPNPEGVPFFGSLAGSSPPQRPTVLPIATSGLIPPCAKTTIHVSLDQLLKIEMLEIDSGGNGVDWIVNGLRIDGTSQLAHSGDLPGDLFATDAIDSFVTFCPGKQIEIDVTYVGLEAAGISFVGRFLGTVVRDDYDVPPPDMRANVRVTGQPALGEDVIARCNWRAPYVRPSAP